MWLCLPGLDLVCILLDDFRRNVVVAVELSGIAHLAVARGRNLFERVVAVHDEHALKDRGGLAFNLSKRWLARLGIKM